MPLIPRATTALLTTRMRFSLKWKPSVGGVSICRSSTTPRPVANGMCCSRRRSFGWFIGRPKRHEHANQNRGHDRGSGGARSGARPLGHRVCTGDEDGAGCVPQGGRGAGAQARGESLSRGAGGEVCGAHGLAEGRRRGGEMKSDERYARFIAECCEALEVSVEDVLGRSREAGPVMMARFMLTHVLRKT